ncbi:MAG: AI-2E family transporter [archaeon]
MAKTDSIWTYYGLILALVLFIFISPFRDILAYSLFIYYIARPFNRLFFRITRSKTFSALLSIIIILIPIMFIAAYTLSVGAAELTNYAATIPEEQRSGYMDMIIKELNMTTIAEPWDAVISVSHDKELEAMMLDILDRSVAYFFTFIGIIFNIFLVFVISFYLIRDGKNLKNLVLEDIFKNELLARKYFAQTDRALFRIFFGNILNAIITAILAMIVYSAFNAYAPQHLNLPYPMLLAILTGLASLIPMVGVKLIWIPATVYLMISSFMNATIIPDLVPLASFLVAVNLIVDMLPDFVLRPFVTAKGMHTGAMMLSYIFGPIVFGISGIFIGPMIVVLASNYATIVLPELKKR